MFSTLSKISPDDKSTWDKSFITIDIDWADDEIIEFTADILEKKDIEVTWFVTHQTSILDRLRENPKFELGIHPNFNYLLGAESAETIGFEDILLRLLDIVPEARSLRSHSLVSSTKIIQAMPNYGLTHESNIYVPASAGIELKPFRVWNDIVRIPHFFEDDLELFSGGALSFFENRDRASDESIFFSGLRVYDFHPIHIYLNTEKIARYEQSRLYHGDLFELEQYRYKGFGTRNILEAILGLS